METKGDKIRRWQVEIQQAEQFKEKTFGCYDQNRILGAGENIEYYERGDTADGTVSGGIPDRPYTATINLVYTLAKNIVPSLYYRNPRVLAFPKRKQDEESAPIAQALLNYYFTELGVKETNQLAILDAFLLGMGITKIGYATQFGMDIPDEGEAKRREKKKSNKLLEMLGIKGKQKEEEKKQNIELQENVVAENPYITYVSPFDFLIDPRATSIYDAQWVAHKYLKTLKEVQSNKNFKNTSKLNGLEVPDSVAKDVPETQIDNFKTVQLYEIHYKTDEGINLLVIAKEADNYEALYHDKSIYEMDGFQFEVLTFNRHGHKLYPKSDVDIIKPLQDRIALTFDAILEQVDKFVAKVIVNEQAMTAKGKTALENGDIGAICYTQGVNPSEVVQQIQFTQVKADMMNLVDYLVDVITLETGLTRAQMTGISNATTATEAQIGQGGSNIRLFARSESVADYSNRQARKLWQVVRQFVDIEGVELITGEEYMDEKGVPRFPWINQMENGTVAKAELNFQIEVGSSQKPDLAVVRKEFENFINLVGRPEVVALLQQQGKFLDVAELIRVYMKLYPEVMKDTSRIIKPLQAAPQGQMTPEQMQSQLAGGPGGSLQNNPNNLRQQQTPTAVDIQEQVGGEAGMI